ncbi:MAG: hypothetical protein IKM54_05620, partial [Butyricicoccus sp.]|nr:hypothetical protein [Butyricicoccus sp.]
AAYRCTDASSGPWVTSDPLFEDLDYLAQNDIAEGCVYFRYGSLRDVDGLSDRLVDWYASDHTLEIPPHGDGEPIAGSSLLQRFGGAFNTLLRSLIR